MDGMKRRRAAVALTAAVFLLLCAGPVAQLVQGQDTGVSPRSGNKILLAASSPFEDMIDDALVGDLHGAGRALAAYDRQAGEVRKVLPDEQSRRLGTLVSNIRGALREANEQAVAVNAVEAYRILVDALNPAGLIVPKEVSLLDYVGFKARVILHDEPPDWGALRNTAAVAQQLWSTLEPGVDDSGLRDAVSTTISGMVESADIRSVEMAEFAAEEDLALVDLLESYFKRRAGSS